MAVENKYVNANIVADKKAAQIVVGADVKYAVQSFETAAADDNNSVYRVFKDVNPDIVPLSIEIFNDAITGGTDYDLGGYLPISKGGAVVDQDILGATHDLSSAHILGAALEGMKSVDVADLGKKLYELLGHTTATKKDGYDIALTGVAVGSTASTITLVMKYSDG